jgi:hypothetical protein
VAHPAASPKAKDIHASESLSRIKTQSRIPLISNPNAKLLANLIVLEVTDMRHEYYSAAVLGTSTGVC